MSTSWGGVLDAFERTLIEQYAALERGEADTIEAFVPPQGLGPLPRELAPRARALLLQAEELTRDVRGRAAATSREIAMLGRIRPSDPSPSYLDQAM